MTYTPTFNELVDPNTPQGRLKLANQFRLISGVLNAQGVTLDSLSDEVVQSIPSKSFRAYPHAVGPNTSGVQGVGYGPLAGTLSHDSGSITSSNLLFLESRRQGYVRVSYSPGAGAVDLQSTVSAFYALPSDFVSWEATALRFWWAVYITGATSGDTHDVTITVDPPVQTGMSTAQQISDSTLSGSSLDLPGSSGMTSVELTSLTMGEGWTGGDLVKVTLDHFTSLGAGGATTVQHFFGPLEVNFR